MSEEMTFTLRLTPGEWAVVIGVVWCYRRGLRRPLQWLFGRFCNGDKRADMAGLDRDVRIETNISCQCSDKVVPLFWSRIRSPRGEALYNASLKDIPMLLENFRRDGL